MSAWARFLDERAKFIRWAHEHGKSDFEIAELLNIEPRDVRTIRISERARPSGK